MITKVSFGLLLQKNRRKRRGIIIATNHCTLHIVAINGHLPVVQYLCDQGADKEARDYNGRTPLHRAASFGHLPVPCGAVPARVRECVCEREVLTEVMRCIRYVTKIIYFSTISPSLGKHHSQCSSVIPWPICYHLVRLLDAMPRRRSAQCPLPTRRVE